MAADAMVEDINYTMVTDIQISEKTNASVQTDNVAALKQGTSGYKFRPVHKLVISINTRPALCLLLIK
ncbi:TraT complement resistance protein Flags: Precursor [Salmonella enterica subsp. arizonae]|nr:TraT complement resistance protein Flags: Precursor [Salmonella enterica subsp. arizonae]